LEKRGTVLVTGGARRIGRAICKALAVDGWRVLVHARIANDPDAIALADEIGGRAFFADLAEPLGSARLFNDVCNSEPEICAIVNNAAVFSPLSELPQSKADRIMAINAVAPEKLMTMLALRLMTNDERSPSLPRFGSVVNLLDTRILCGALGTTHPATQAPSQQRTQDSMAAPPMQRAQDLIAELRSAYAKSKFALLCAQRKIAMQFASVLRVNGVAPGPVLAPKDAHEKGGETLLDSRPSPEDVAFAVGFLLSANAVTGTIIPVDSGQHLLAEYSPEKAL